MIEQSYSARLRELSKDYYQSHLGFEEYRRLRKEVLDSIDEEFNGRKPEYIGGQEDRTERRNNNASVLMKTIAFFKNNDIDE